MKVFMVAVFNDRSTNNSQLDGFSKCGVDTYGFNYREVAKDLGLQKRDDLIIEKVNEWKPDIVFFSKCNGVDVRVVEECGKVSKTVLWYMDPPGGNLNGELVKKAHVADYVYVAAWEPYCIIRNLVDPTKVFYLQEGFDHRCNYPLGMKKIYDVSFIGTIKHSRKNYLDAVGFKVFNNAYGLDHSKVVSQSKINLNFTEMAGGTSDRLYKILAAGGFVLTESWPKMDKDFTNGEDLVIFNGIDDLKEKIDYYLKNDAERQRIADNGLKTVQKFSRVNFSKVIMDKYKEDYANR